MSVEWSTVLNLLALSIAAVIGVLLGVGLTMATVLHAVRKVADSGAALPLSPSSSDAFTASATTPNAGDLQLRRVNADPVGASQPERRADLASHEVPPPAARPLSAPRCAFCESVRSALGLRGRDLVG